MSTIPQSAFENVLWLVLGGLTGVLTILMVWWSVQRMRPGTGPGSVARGRSWSGYVFRLAVVASFLAWVARQGAGPLMWAFVGLMACRWAAIPWLSQRSASNLKETMWRD